MGLVPIANHLALIRDCYPPYSSSASPADLPLPVSNGLGKLSFYAINRPKKLPKVVSVLVERATKDHNSSGTKARQDLGVTVDVVRGLIIECGVSGKEGAGELIKTVAEEALRVAELALGGDVGKDGRAVRSKRDPEMEAKGASLFHAVATFLTSPFYGLNDGLGKQYLRCLSLLSALAQLQGPEHASSRYIALKALEAAARSDLLYTTASDYDRQIEELAPALLCNCLDVPVQDLRKQFNVSDAETRTSPLSSTISARKAAIISHPSSPPSDLDLASLAVPILRLITRRSDSSELVSLHSSISAWLDRYQSGELWHAQSQPLVEWLASSLLAASAPSYRPAVIGWWADQVGEIYDTGAQHKSITLLYVLANLLRGKTNILELGVGGVLNTLAELLVRRSKSGARTRPPTIHQGDSGEEQETNGALQPQLDYEKDPDPLTRPILSTISALASKIYYTDQLDDLVADLIDILRSLRREAGSSEGRPASGLSGEERTRAAVRLVVAMRLLIEEAHEGEGAVVGVATFNGKASAEKGKDKKGPPQPNGNAAPVSENGGGVVKRPPLPPPVDTDGTIRGPSVALGAMASNGSSSDDSFIIRGKKESSERPTIVADDQAPLDALGRPLIRVSPTGQRNRVSPRTFEKSLFLLTEGNAILRGEYARAAVTYLERELDVEGAGQTATLSPDLASFWRQLHTAIYTLATSPSLSSASSASHQDLVHNSNHPLTGVHSQRSLRRLSIPSADSPAVSAPPSTTSYPVTSYDYSSLLSLVRAAQRRASPSAVLEGVPVLLALDRAAAAWDEGGEGREKSGERAQATRETAAAGLREVGQAWGVKEVEQIAEEALQAMSPSVIPPFTASEPLEQPTFAASPSAAPAALYASVVVDALSLSAKLQTATGLDRTSLSSLLGAAWTVKAAQESRLASPGLPYFYGDGAASSRSVLQLPLSGTLRLSSDASTHGSATPSHGGIASMRTPSLADLQSSLSGSGSPGAGSVSGYGGRSARTSATPSIASTNGGGTLSTSGGGEGGTRRRTSRAKADVVLERVGRRRVTTASSYRSGFLSG
ncbi:hypothetical protein JCM21900_006882 [Sporobolomyces salmonicolor]